MDASVFQELSVRLVVLRSIALLAGFIGGIGATACSSAPTSPDTPVRSQAAGAPRFDTTPSDSLVCRSGYIVIGGKTQCAG
jgi:hypothetical protein